MQHVENLIIGAGPAGLAVAGRFRKNDIPFEIVERSDKFAIAWHNHYDRLCLHTVKEWSHLPHLPFPAEYPRYVPREQFAEYCAAYADHFNIRPHFGQEVTSVRRQGSQWLVETKQGMSFLANHVIVATGVNRVPFWPTWPGQEEFAGTIEHSRIYKNPKPYYGKKVLIVGMGNTGAEVALDLAEQGVDVAISVRSPVNIVPRDINGRPTQVTAKLLAKLPFGLGDWLGTQIRKVVVGDLSKYGLQTANIPPARQLRDTGKTPVVDLGTVEQIKAGNIHIIPDIDHFIVEGVVDVYGDTHKFDAVLLATGYRAKVEDFLETTEGLLDKHGVPKQPIGEGRYEGLYFVGFDNYKLGGILGTIFTDSQTITRHVLAQAKAVHG